MFRAHGTSTSPLAPAQARRPPRIPRELITKGRGLDIRTRLDIHRFLLLGWREDSIANHVGVSLSTVYQIEQNLKRYGSTRKPTNPNVVLGHPRKISAEDEQALFDELYRSGWMFHDEMAYWLY